MDKDITTVKQNYTIALLVLTGVLTGGTLWCSLRPSEWAFFFLPVLGAVATALVWVAVARFFLCRDPRRLLAKSFKTPLKLALICPIWCSATLTLAAIPNDTSGWDEELAALTATFMVLVCGAALLIGTVVLGALSIFKAYTHWKNTPATETRFYKEGPFAFSILMFALMMGILIFAFAAGM